MHTLLHLQKCFFVLILSLWSVVEPCESGEEETMETLVAADSLLNMDCPDTLSLEQHYCERMQHTHTHTHTHTPELTLLKCTVTEWRCHSKTLPPLCFDIGHVWLQDVIFRHGGHTAVLFHQICLCPPAAQTFLPSLGDVITTPVTQVTVSAEGIVGAVDQPQWHSLHTEKPAAQLQSKKRGQSLSGLSAEMKLNYGSCD